MLSIEQRSEKTCKYVLPLLVDPEKDIGALVSQYCHDLAVAAEKTCLRSPECCVSDHTCHGILERSAKASESAVNLRISRENLA